MAKVNMQAERVSDNGTRTIACSDSGRLLMTGGFSVSSYTGDKSATTTVTGQSTSIASGALLARVSNLDATNFVRVAFGASSSAAESNAASGITIEAGQSLVLGIPSDATHIAYVGDTGNVTINVAQGV